MKAEELCVSLEMAIALHKFGYKQRESYFVWVKGFGNDVNVCPRYDCESSGVEIIVSAPTVAELFVFDEKENHDILLRDVNKQARLWIFNEILRRGDINNTINIFESIAMADKLIIEAGVEIAKGKY